MEDKRTTIDPNAPHNATKKGGEGEDESAVWKRSGEGYSLLSFTARVDLKQSVVRTARKRRTEHRPTASANGRTDSGLLRRRRPTAHLGRCGSVVGLARCGKVGGPDRRPRRRNKGLATSHLRGRWSGWRRPKHGARTVSRRGSCYSELLVARAVWAGVLCSPACARWLPWRAAETARRGRAGCRRAQGKPPLGSFGRRQRRLEVARHGGRRGFVWHSYAALTGIAPSLFLLQAGTDVIAQCLEGIAQCGPRSPSRAPAQSAAHGRREGAGMRCLVLGRAAWAERARVMPPAAHPHAKVAA